MPDPRTSDMHQIQRLFWRQLALESCEFHSKTIFLTELYVKISFISVFSLFMVLDMILSDALILPISQLQTQQVMTSQIRSNTEYLIQT